ncbi:MAG: carbohydrate kinase family protein [Anaerolineae bacterium]|nr:carbohydrate kinase family protein [Anaerolineae bacterium]
MSRKGAVVAGHICLDIIPRIPGGNVQARLTPGALIEIGAALLSTGGPVSNTGRSLHTLGIDTRLMGKVGDDPFGRIILDLIRAQDAALVQNMIVVPGEVSSYSIVLSLPDADRSFLHCPGANHTFGADDLDCDALRDARLFHFGYPPVMERMYLDDGAELETMFRCARETGVITSLDMAMPDPQGPSGRVDWRTILKRTLPHVDIFLPSLDELLVMLRRELPASPQAADALLAEVAAQMLDWGAGIVVLKLGARGLYLRIGARGIAALAGAGWRERELWVPCFVPEPLVGTTGAGDATIAGFLAGVLRGQPVEAALTSAVAVGACNVEAADALSGVRSWDATQARVVAGWARQAVTVGAPGWSWDAGHALWGGPHDAVLRARA